MGLNCPDVICSSDFGLISPIKKPYYKFSYPWVLTIVELVAGNANAMKGLTLLLAEG